MRVESDEWLEPSNLTCNTYKRNITKYNQNLWELFFFFNFVYYGPTDAWITVFFSFHSKCLARLQQIKVKITSPETIMGKNRILFTSLHRNDTSSDFKTFLHQLSNCYPELQECLHLILIWHLVQYSLIHSSSQFCKRLWIFFYGYKLHKKD